MLMTKMNYILKYIHMQKTLTLNCNSILIVTFVISGPKKGNNKIFKSHRNLFLKKHNFIYQLLDLIN